ncbi:JAB1/Mov34/MPN/PAD-1 ubiquitin protease domain-containing protein [Phytophthora infestans]|uniref:JAB1/Mov34/MPN/PAD-1 ubiquitin protease domain-containing protein n=1 Tax=Phytophthora infestans TaxID=4787 RepID=A0A833SFV6_PHYIN|nr:JAB1/Mov34/MPN/PAD-1 ubiquitin protease domain-containing protein [Phytophthora infestans]KAF4129840.1 JAB1/Mov34/MPN/PAD-1 ubiquitin protease domain-containing protein [Phytophthora infestans]
MCTTNVMFATHVMRSLANLVAKMVAPGAKKPPSSRLDASGQEALKARHEALALVEEKFRDFDVVWAKIHGFPWWPGVLFLSWDVVRRAGIRTDPKIMASLVVPPPQKVPVLDATTGEETGEFRTKRHCLVMFLDKFNFSLVEIDPSNVASFTAHYQMYVHAVMGSKSGKWSKKKGEFKRALAKATQLLHMGKNYVEDDLVLLEEPSQAEKKQRMDEMESYEEVRGDESLDDAWDDRESADDAAFSVKEDMAAREKNPARKASSRNTTDRKAKGVMKINLDESYTPVKPRRKAPAKDSKSRARKASRKEVSSDTQAAVVSRSPSPIDLTETPESEKKKNSKISDKIPRLKKRKANGHAKVLVLEDEEVKEEESVADNQVPEEVANFTDKDAPSSRVLTPLSSIWTTGVSRGSKNGSDAHTQLAYKQDFVWDDSVFTDEPSIAEKEHAARERLQAKESAAHIGPGRDRSLGKRQARSVQQSQIRQNLMTGNLDPHTMVQCAAYRPKDYVEDPNSRSRGGPTLDPPLQVVVHPDAVFVADLHAHLATCEIIGFLGGKWDEASKTLYIQAAFPCRSLEIEGDDGSTDVEMDPGSEIELRGIIENAQLEVVGWYHSHPAFAPDPSVRDIENQTSYQQLFQRPNASKETLEPFVGLIVGTYDTRRSTPVSLFRYFHTRGEKVSGGALREIYMPYELLPGRRHFRSVLRDEEREKTRFFPMYRSILDHFKLTLASIKPQLPTDVKASPGQRTASRLSLARVKAQGSVRKRKQSSDDTGNKPAKKTKARSKRTSQSSSAISHIDDGEKQALPASEKELSTPKVTDDAGHNESADTTTKKEESTSNGEVVPDVEMESIVESSSGAGDSARSSAISAEKMMSGISEIEPQVVEVLADVVMTTEIVNDSEKRARKVEKSERINPDSGVDEEKRPRADDSADQKTDALSAQSVTGSSTSGAAKRLAVKTEVDATRAPIHTSAMPPLPAPSPSAVRIGISPSPINATSGRKRTRKPQKTTKNSNRSASPASEGPSPARSPSPHKQTFYHAFHAQGPCFSNGSSHEEVTPPPTRSDPPKPDNILAEDVHYYVVGENMSMTTTCQGIDSASEAKPDNSMKRDKCTSNQDAKECAEDKVDKTTIHDAQVSKDVRSFVTSLVERVVKKMASDVTASTAPAVADGSSGNSTGKVPVNGVAKVKVGAKSLASNSAVDVQKGRSSESKDSGRKQSASVHVESQLFGSHRECEDIQTSLHRMAGHLELLKSSRVINPREAQLKPRSPETPTPASELALATCESKQGDFHDEQSYLTALRTKYGPGVSGCAEQVITLVDYYRDFERRTDLSEIWKARITKLEKIESSLSEYVQHLNIPAGLRQDFIKDLIAYLRESWTIRDRRRRPSIYGSQ